MAWASGSDLADEVWGIVRGFIPVRKRKIVAREIIEVFQKEDADDWGGDRLIEEDAEYPDEDEDLMENEE